MTLLGDVAHLIRSKNAGPFLLTFDVLFDSPATYDRVVRSDKLTQASIGALYGVPESSVALTFYPAANAIKATIPRRVPAGDVGDSDLYGAQQYIPLADVEI
jgi:hypothetical protein